MLDTSIRMLRLLGILQSRPWWSGSDLADRLEVTTRTVRNDIERLRLLGYEVESVTGPAGGYRLGAGDALPPLLLEDDEVVAVAVGLAAAASGSVSGIEQSAVSALAKLERTLPARLRPQIDAVRSAVQFAPPSGPTVDAAVLTAVAAAAHAAEALRFDYEARAGETSVRHVEPNAVVYSGSRWYLLAWDLDRDDWRIFRVDRITPRMPTRRRFTPREAPAEGAAEYVRARVAENY